MRLTGSDRDPSLIMWNYGSIMWNLRRQVNGGAQWPTTSGTQAVDRAALLVSTVVQADEPLTFADLQEACDLPKSTTSRMLTALERSELLERNDDGSYVAGSLFWLYAARHDPRRGPGPAGRPDAGGDRRGDPRDREPQRGPRRPGRAGRPGRLAVPPRHPRLDPGRRARALLVARQGLPRLGRRRPARRAARAPTTATPHRPDARCAPTATRTRKRGWAITVDELEVGLVRRRRARARHPRPGRRGPRRLGTHATAGGPVRRARPAVDRPRRRS